MAKKYFVIGKHYQYVQFGKYVGFLHTLKEINRLMFEALTTDSRNREIYKKRLLRKQEIVEAVKDLWGSSLVLNYIDKVRVDPPQKYLNIVYGRLKRFYGEKEDKIKEEIEQTKKLENQLLTQEAVSYLQVRNFTLGKDFNLWEAINKADNIAEEEYIKDYLENSDGFIEFCGMNCEDCLGWDGRSHRCECGNRRAYWEQQSGHSFKNPYISAMAY
jgi:hypothetical protein